MSREDVGGFEVHNCGSLLFLVFHVLAHQENYLEHFHPLFQAWSKASEIAEAYQIGKAESEAAWHLFNECDKEVVEHLSRMVKILGSI